MCDAALQHLENDLFWALNRKETFVPLFYSLGLVVPWDSVLPLQVSLYFVFVPLLCYIWQYIRSLEWVLQLKLPLWRYAKGAYTLHAISLHSWCLFNGDGCIWVYGRLRNIQQTDTQWSWNAACTVNVQWRHYTM